MSQSTEKGFFSKKTMLCFVILSLICTIYMIAAHCINFILWDNTAFCLSVLCCVFSIVVYFTYKKHDANAMKPSIGILFGIMAQQGCSVFTAAIAEVDLSDGLIGCVRLILVCLRLILIITICINHILISSGHQSSKKAVLFNLGSLVVLIMVYALEIIVSACCLPLEKTIFLSILNVISTCALAVIIIVEKKLDYFRALREETKND